METHDIIGDNGVFSVSYNKEDAEPTVGLGVQVEITSVQYNHKQGLNYASWLKDMLQDIDNLKYKGEYIFDWLERVVLESLMR